MTVDIEFFLTWHPSLLLRREGGVKGFNGGTEKGDKGNNGEGYNSLIQKGKNLLNESELEIGGLTNKGVENNGATSFKRTGYIYLEKGSYVYSNYNKGYTNFRLCIYDLNKEYSNVVLIKAVKGGNYGMVVEKPIIIDRNSGRD